MVDEKSRVEILRTKLHRPPVHRDHIHRPRLLEVFNNADPQPLTVVTPPRGFSKCTVSKRKDPAPITSLDGQVRDQCELMGILNSLHELHLSLLSVKFLN